MKQERRYKIYDKEDKTPLPEHNFITKELIRRKFISSDLGLELYYYDLLFEDLLSVYDFKIILVCTGYTISCIKRNNFKDEEGAAINNLYSYFKVSLINNIKRYTAPPVYYDWLEDD